MPPPVVELLKDGNDRRSSNGQVHKPRRNMLNKNAVGETWRRARTYLTATNNESKQSKHQAKLSAERRLSLSIYGSSLGRHLDEELDDPDLCNGS